MAAYCLLPTAYFITEYTMPEITAASVKALRDKTNLPMMDCKKALEVSGGDENAAVDWLRSQGKKTMESRSGAKPLRAELRCTRNLEKTLAR